MIGRTAIIATKHWKEKVIAPILEKEVGLKCVVAINIDTDVLGTFSGEIERKDDPITTARNKCKMALASSDYDLALASEGSFGPHPTIGFINADDEILLLFDKKNNLEIISRELSTQTNFSGQEISSFSELEAFAKTALFPSHGLILRHSKDSNSDLYKGITNAKDLRNAFDVLMEKYGTVYAETDMRALFNPTRMQVIEKATLKLVDKIKSLCPECHSPGFSMTEARPGLICANCGLPTRSTLLYILTCQACGYAAEKLHPHGKVSEDPMYCDICNP